ncbi:methyltransferase, TIGR04325 family [Oleiharenicola lentus]|uniref:methyltransferase, TIGR04325 family n=1 Tax=Oleiharenicola lentus TaxID=2508720 RepID=UPI003F66D31F
MNETPIPDYSPGVVYSGDYATFAEARACSTGYEEGIILERTRVALHKVVRGEAAYERDSVTFDKLELPFPLLALLTRAAAENDGRLSVLDFGGALGSSYFLCRSFLKSLPTLEWSIVEQPAHVACGQQEFANETLRFYPTIQECLKHRRPNVLLLSGLLQCLPEPWEFLRDAATHDFDWIILDRTPFIPATRDRLTVETVAPRIYPASYPAWFFSLPRFQNNLPAGWVIDAEFDALDRQLLDGVEIIFKGFALRRQTAVT